MPPRPTALVSLLLVLLGVSACHSSYKIPGPWRDPALKGSAARTPRRPQPQDEAGRSGSRGRPARRAADRDAAPDPAAGPLVYGFEQLREGRIQHVLHGSGPLWNPEEHAAYREAFAQTSPFLVRFGINIRPNRRFSFEELIDNLADDFAIHATQLPVLTIKFDEIRDGKPNGLDGELARGLYDDRIDTLASLIQSQPKPVFVRIGPECNGDWNGYHVDTFPDAFRRVVTRFREAGVDNAIYMWNVKMIRERNPTWMRYYPGDEYVDWWSIDLFTEDFEQPGLFAQVKSFLDQAEARGMPVMIPESCPNGLDLDAPSTWDDWFGPYFELVREREIIKAFCYSNRDFATEDRNLADWGDMRLDRSKLAELYVEELSRPLYLHQQAWTDEDRARLGASDWERPGKQAGAEDDPRVKRHQQQRRRAAAQKDGERERGGDGDSRRGGDGDR